MLDIQVTGDWEIRICVNGDRFERITVNPSHMIDIQGEEYLSLPLFDYQAPGWAKGEKLRGVSTQETTACFMLEPASLSLSSDPQGGLVYERGVDYEADLDWGTIGRLPSGRISAGQPVYASYRHGLSRIDTLIQDRDGWFYLLPGQPHIATPVPPSLPPGVLTLANLWLPGRMLHLTSDNLFPLYDATAEEPAPYAPAELERRLPRALARLKAGGKIRLLAWGDSVTDASYLPDPSTERWQEQFAARLRQRFPRLQVELVTQGWGGRNTSSFLEEPPGSEHNYREKVLGAHPDLVISEFVNDAFLPVEKLEVQYSSFLSDFTAAGAEWIILTPHYVRGDWMGLSKEKEIDDDPRPYVAWLRQFASRHMQGVALADAARKWGRLWRQGIPYTTLLSNAINHPNPTGMKLFADSLMELFEGPGE
jgi:lysophospholipase L1-like esterase